MKELSVEEKAKRYDEALGKARRYYDEYKTRDNILYVEDMEDMFPELKESEGERMIQYFKDLAPFDKADELYEKYGFSHKDALAWLEKQGEQKQTVIIPRFRVEDVITSTKNSALKYKIKAVGVLNELGEYDYVVEDVTDNPDYKGRIRNMSISKVDEWGVVVKQKSEWGDEDEKMIHNILDSLFCYAGKLRCEKDFDIVADVEKEISWLKSLKDRYTWRPSDEQMNALNYVVNLMASSERPTENDLYYNILKSLKEQLKRLREE